MIDNGDSEMARGGVGRWQNYMPVGRTAGVVPNQVPLPRPHLPCKGGTQGKERSR
jgi:hypothetical protein